jgi:hypothetical protein
VEPSANEKLQQISGKQNANESRLTDEQMEKR